MMKFEGSPLCAATEFATVTTPMGEVATVRFYNWDSDSSLLMSVKQLR